jgi:hypothetical protein
MSSACVIHTWGRALVNYLAFSSLEDSTGTTYVRAISKATCKVLGTVEWIFIWLCAMLIFRWKMWLGPLGLRSQVGVLDSPWWWAWSGRWDDKWQGKPEVAPNIHSFEYSQSLYSFGRSQWQRGLRHELSSSVGSNPTRSMDVCVRLFCVCVLLCVRSGLATGWSPVEGVLPSV